MNVDKDSFDIAIDLVQVVIAPLAGYGVWVMREIRQQLRVMNGRVGRLETWSIGHQEQCTERHRDEQEHRRATDRRIDLLRGTAGRD